MSELFPVLRIHVNKHMEFSILLIAAQVLTSTRVTCGEGDPLLTPGIPEWFGLEGTWKLLSLHPAMETPSTTSVFFQSL